MCDPVFWVHEEAMKCSVLAGDDVKIAYVLQPADVEAWRGDVDLGALVTEPAVNERAPESIDHTEAILVATITIQFDGGI